MLCRKNVLLPSANSARTRYCPQLVRSNRGNIAALIFEKYNGVPILFLNDWILLSSFVSFLLNVRALHFQVMDWRLITPRKKAFDQSRNRHPGFFHWSREICRCAPIEVRCTLSRHPWWGLTVNGPSQRAATVMLIWFSIRFSPCVNSFPNRRVGDEYRR